MIPVVKMSDRNQAPPVSVLRFLSQEAVPMSADKVATAVRQIHRVDQMSLCPGKYYRGGPVYNITGLQINIPVTAAV